MHMDASSESPLDAALFYASKGWRVVPTSGRLKHPVLDDWQNLATNDPEKVKSLFAASPSHAQDVAIVTGPESGIFVLDVDPRHGGDDTLDDLTATYGHLPDTPMSITGSQGQHFVFRYPAGMEIKNSAGKVLGPGLDIRGDNGQVSAPPSVHENGKSYAWEFSLDPHEIEVAEAPDWLLRLLTEVPEAPMRAPRRERPDGSVLPGDIFNDTHEWEDLLEAVGAERVGARRDREGNVMEFWSRPRMEGEAYFVPHTSATLNYGGSDVLKVFSPNWPPLEEGQTYDKLGFWAEYAFEGATHEEKVAKAVSKLGYDALDEQYEPFFGELESHLAEVAAEIEAKEVDESSWMPKSLKEARRKGPPPPPDLGRRDDDECLLYRGKLHYFYGPPECGKSWAAQLFTAQAVMDDGVDVAYFDFENSDWDMSERLDSFGVDDDGLDRVLYSNPDKPMSEAVWGKVKALLLERAPKMVVVDGVSNAMSLFGCDPLTHADTVKFEMMFLRPLCLTGAAVVCIDHAPKTQGDSKPSIFGAQHKLAMVTGATFLFQIMKPFGRDMDGVSKMIIQKDKPGYLRRISLNGHIGSLEINASGAFEAKVTMPTLEDGQNWVPDAIMEKLWSHVEANPGKFKREVLEEVTGKAAWKRAGLERLIRDGHLEDNLGSGRLYPVRPFGEPRPSVMDTFDQAYGQPQAEPKPFEVSNGQITPVVDRRQAHDEFMDRQRRQMLREGLISRSEYDQAEHNVDLWVARDGHIEQVSRNALDTERIDGRSSDEASAEPLAEPERSEGEAQEGPVCAAKGPVETQQWDPFS